MANSRMPIQAFESDVFLAGHIFDVGHMGGKNNTIRKFYICEVLV